MGTYAEKHPEHKPSRVELNELVEHVLKHLDRHEVTQIGENVWRCARPDSWVYGFYVSRVPGGWRVHGDLGDLFVYRSDDISWLRGAVRSPDYLWEKVPEGCKVEHFWPGDGLEALDDMVDDAEPKDRAAARERAQAIYDAWTVQGHGVLENYQGFIDAWWTYEHDTERVPLPNMSPGAVRCVAALRWLCARMPEELPPLPWRVDLGPCAA